MKKKILFALSAAGGAMVLVPLFAAFEAHVINVTARIENALSVPLEHIDFGTVFPQEQLDEGLHIELSQSFLEEDRVDDVEYIIRQKPKCGITEQDGEVLVGGTVTGHVIASSTAPGGYIIDCGEEPQLEQGQSFGPLPLLCPYLSKHKDETDPDDNQQEVEIDAFHNPFGTSTSTDEVIWLDAIGRLAKSDSDFQDWWVIDLKVPCFGDHCAQDWEAFVEGINPDALPADQWVQPIENEHKIFGCDLWVEVTGVSEFENGPTT